MKSPALVNTSAIPKTTADTALTGEPENDKTDWVFDTFLDFVTNHSSGLRGKCENLRIEKGESHMAQENYHWDDTLSRDHHLRPGGPKRMLVLDGGGIRGLLSCGILKSIEDILRQRMPAGPKRDAFVLADYYDFIGGTSTGSIIAAWLSLGRSVDDLTKLYRDLGPTIFGKANPFGKYFVNRFDADALDEHLRDHLQSETLNSERLVTGFGVTAKRMDTGSGWLLANNPKAPYWDGDDEDRPNAKYKLRDVVRASAAAPAYFDFVDIDIEWGRAPGGFMDGAVAGHNNPSIAFWLYVTSPGYGMNWPVGKDNLLITSVGTGTYRQAFDPVKLRKMPAAARAIFSLASSIQDVAQNNLQLMQSIGHTINAFPINSEVDAYASPEEKASGYGHNYCVPTNPLFTYQRFDAVLDAKALHENLGVPNNGTSYTRGIMKRLQSMDRAEKANLDRLLEIGLAVGKLKVGTEHFPRCFDLDAPPPEAATPTETAATSTQINTTVQTPNHTGPRARISQTRWGKPL